MTGSCRQCKWYRMTRIHFWRQKRLASYADVLVEIERPGHSIWHEEPPLEQKQEHLFAYCNQNTSRIWDAGTKLKTLVRPFRTWGSTTLEYPKQTYETMLTCRACAQYISLKVKGVWTADQKEDTAQSNNAHTTKPSTCKQ